MNTKAAKNIAKQLWQIISSHSAYQAYKVPEDRAEILEHLAERLDEEINRLIGEDV